MNTKENGSALEDEIVRIKKRITELGPIHPGSLSQQFQKCGNPNCKCMNPKNPQPHGPFYKLSYVFKGKTGCRFVRASCENEVIRRVAAYKELRALIDEWIKLSIQAGVIEFFPDKPRKKSSKRKSSKKKK
ncbi:MAG: hypothetical protein KAH23_08880 [Kiritimatiellae bacterium]|nr:hypothetical protein [Kiritimatiellia bacterium]